MLDPQARTVSPDDSGQMIRQIVQGNIGKQIRQRENASSYILGKHGIYAVQAVWVHKSDTTGKPPAYLVMARLLRETELSNALQVEAELTIGATPQITSLIGDRKNSVHTLVTPAEIGTTIGLYGQDGNVVGAIGFVTARNISAAGSRSIQLAITAMALGLVALTVLLGISVNQVSVLRLQALRAHIRRFNKEREPIDPQLMASSDEIGTLARQFDQLGNELQQAEEELRQQSYVQGKADSAVGLLHNVRNALGPLQVKYDKWQGEDAKPFRSQLKLALDELSKDDCAAQRRTSLEAFVKAASLRMIDQGDARTREIGEIKSSIDQILAILADYDFDSSSNVKFEAVDIGPIIAKEVHNLEAAERRPIALAMPDKLPRVWANHLHLSQIVTNLLSNAVEAMQAAQVEPMHIEIACHEAGGAIEFTLADNGEGVMPEQLARIFERGVSTRDHKSGGMGLHWSANAARAMGGALSLESEGQGCGATARLKLPSAAAVQVDDGLDIAA